ncbi:S8 family peptidase [Labrys sp. La1]|uniref:S8 family peptidase n=1 Tax=Labrys sp. La1 TaxID=3404917 RepID=UPI003EBC7030
MATNATFSDDPNDIAPDRALVLELKSDVPDFEREANRIGLYWLLEGINEAETDEALEEEALSEEVEVPRKANRLYVSMPSRESLAELLRLWDIYRKKAPRPENFSAWWNIFAMIEDIRPWGPKDRLDEFAAAFLAHELEEDPNANVLLEINLWYSADPLVQEQRATVLRSLVSAAGGSAHDFEIVPEIGYHAALIELPASQVRAILEASGEIILTHQVMSIRPQSLGSWPILRHESPLVEETGVGSEQELGEPVAALLDGYPIENHVLLQDRIDVFPLEVDPSMASVRHRRHGTQMASLILHGDRGVVSEPIASRLLIVPVLTTHEAGGCERTPPLKLPIGLIRRAVEAIKIGALDLEPLGPRVVVINHSLGDVNQPFIGHPSYWAKLLDHLAYKHNLLFVVSAGNVHRGIEIGHFKSIAEFRSAAPDHRRDAMLSGLERAKFLRTMLSPAEAMNVLTVGAVHHDYSTAAPPPATTNPYTSLRMVNIASGLGLGIGGAVKPDLVLPGGRQVAHPIMGKTFEIHGREIEQLGQLAAAPDAFGGKIDLMQRSTGTSNAAALATRAAVLVSEALDEIASRTTPGLEAARASILKCLVAHGCNWGEVGTFLDGIYPPHDKWYGRRANIARFLGFGESDPERFLDGSPRQVTMLAFGSIKANKRDVFQFPLPDALSSRTDFRRIVVTLAWMSPLRPKARNYRAVALELTGPNGTSDIWSGVERRQVPQPPHSLAAKGTLIHAIFEGRRAMPFAAGSSIEIGVQRRPGFSTFNRIPTSYAVAMTIEVADTIRADIYNQVREELRARARAARVRTR